MTLSNKCPKCGAAFAHRDFFGWCTFECGTTLLFNGEVRWEGHECFTRQLAQSQAEVNELNNLLRAAGWGQGEIDNAAAVVDEVEAKLATAQAENAQYAHDFKALRGAMGCDGSDVPQLVAAWDKAQAENERLRAGYQRSKYESAPCPGCEWDNGKLVKLCALHARIAALEAEAQTTRRDALMFAAGVVARMLPGNTDGRVALHKASRKLCELAAKENPNV